MQILSVDNPATLRRLGEVPDSDAAAVEAAVNGARAALASWQELDAAQRRQLLRGVAGRVRAEAGSLADLLSAECGKPLCEARDCVGAVARLFDSAGGPLPYPAEPGAVIAALLPGNFPLLFLAVASVTALAAGHVVIAKAPPLNPLTCLRLATLLGDLPAGVLTVLPGGAEAGLLLARHPAVDRIDFTGSAAVGAALAAAVPDKPLQLQPGSVDACIVCSDADLELAVPGIAWARLANAGQAGTVVKHLYVERAIAGAFVDRLHQFVGLLDVDDPRKAPTDIGPLISLQAARRVEDQVGVALREGARLILGGRRFRPSGLPGHFFQPTILTDVAAGSSTTREEILGPVIAVTPVEDHRTALRLAAQASPACCVSIHTADPERALRDVEAIAVAEVRVNDPALGAAGPFAGLRHAALLQALAGIGAPVPGQRIVHAAPRLEAKPWWFPYATRASAWRDTP